MKALNVGSGQARFEGPEWLNVDCVSRQGQVPDVIDDARALQTFPDASVDLIVLQHCLEHFVLPDAVKVISACGRVLCPGGALVVTLPDMRALAQAWLMGKIDDYLFFVNAMGAYQGEDGDCHRWHYTERSFKELLQGWQVKAFDWRPLGVSRVKLASDWWIQGWEATK